MPVFVHNSEKGEKKCLVVAFAFLAATLAGSAQASPDRQAYEAWIRAEAELLDRYGRIGFASPSTSETRRPFRVAVTGPNEVSEDGTQQASIRVTLLESPGPNPVTLWLEVNDPSEGRLSRRSLTFSAMGQSQSVDVLGADDNDIDGSTEFYVRFSRSVHAASLDSNARVGGREIRMPEPIRFVNRDNEFGIVVGDAAPSVEIDRSWASLPVRLSRTPSAPVFLESESLTPQLCRIKNCEGRALSLKKHPVFVDLLDNDSEASARESCRFLVRLKSTDPRFDGKSARGSLPILDDEARFEISESSAIDDTWSVAPTGPKSVEISYFEHNPARREDANVLTTKRIEEVERAPNFLELTTLHAVVRSSFSKTLTDSEVSEVLREHRTGLAKIDHATRGVIRAVDRQLVLPLHLTLEDFPPCRKNLVDQGVCRAIDVELGSSGLEKIKEAIQASGFDPFSYDAIHLTIPYAENSRGQGDWARGALAWASIAPRNPQDWLAGRVFIYPYRHRNGRFSSFSGVVAHELGHILEAPVEARNHNLPSARLPLVANMHGDTKQLREDFIALEENNTARAWLATTDIRSPTPSDKTFDIGKAQVVAVGDTTGNKSAELVLFNRGTISSWLSRWNVNQSPGQPTLEAFLGDVELLKMAGLADLNGDKRPDLPYEDPVVDDNRREVGFFDFRGEQPGRKKIGEIESPWRLAGAGEMGGPRNLDTHDSVLFFQRDDLISDFVSPVRYWIVRGGRKVGEREISERTSFLGRLTGFGRVNADASTDIIWQAIFSTSPIVWMIGPDGQVSEKIWLQTVEDAAHVFVGTGNLDGSQVYNLWTSLFQTASVPGASASVLGWDGYNDNALWAFYHYNTPLWIRVAKDRTLGLGSQRSNDRWFRSFIQSSPRLRHASVSNPSANEAPFDSTVCSRPILPATLAPLGGPWIPWALLVGLRSVGRVRRERLR